MVLICTSLKSNDLSIFSPSYIFAEISVKTIFYWVVSFLIKSYIFWTEVFRGVVLTNIFSYSEVYLFIPPTMSLEDQKLKSSREHFSIYEL